MLKKKSINMLLSLVFSTAKTSICNLKNIIPAKKNVTEEKIPPMTTNNMKNRRGFISIWVLNQPPGLKSKSL